MCDEDVNTSKSARIYAWLRAEFDTGRIVPGDRLPSEKELGERFGAARPAVRQALARLIHEGLAESVRGVGSFRREPRPNASRDAALVLPSISSYIYPELAEAANTAFRARGLNTLFECTGGDVAVERSVLETLKARRPAAVVVSPIQRRLPGQGVLPGDPEVRGNLDLLKDLRASGVVVVLLDKELGEESFSSIVIDDYSSGAKAVDYLAAKGHRNIAVAWRPGHAPFEGRRRGALDRLSARGLPAGPENELRVEGKGPAAPAEAAARFFSAGNAPHGVLLRERRAGFLPRASSWPRGASAYRRTCRCWASTIPRRRA